MSPDKIAARQFDEIIRHGLRVLKGRGLYRMGDSFDSVYAIRGGYFKTIRFDPNGEQHIVGFQMAGDLLGLDGIATGSQDCDAIALEDSEVCGIVFSQLELLLGQTPAMLRNFHKMMSRRITRDKGSRLLLVNMSGGTAIRGIFA